MLILRVSQQLHDQLRTARVIGFSRRKSDEGLGEESCAIAPSWQRRGWQLGVVLALGLSGAIAFSRDSALAQITPDLTLGGERSRVAPGFVIQNIPSDAIYGGAVRGSILFHSFSQFDVASERGAFFTNPVGVENILSRVTGTLPSQIFGTLGVLGNANLFLINPNGIIFGQNARLNLNGSFVATTANGIGLDNQTIFSASRANPPPSTLLTINPSAFLFNQFRNQSNGPIVVNQGAVLSVGKLRTPRSLLLVGGNVLVDGATLQGFDGSQIQVAGFTGTGNVGLTVNGNNLSLALPANGVTGANVRLSNGALINVGSRTTNAGDILLAGGTVALLDRSQLSSSTFGVGNAGNVRLEATDNVFIDNSTIFSKAVDGSSGNAGDIEIFTGSLLMRGSSRLDSNNSSSGVAGNVIISARDPVVIENSTIASQSNNNSTNGFGLIKITATQGSVFLNNVQLSTTNSGSGYAGNISISARERVSIENQSRISSQGNLGQIFIGESDYISFSPQIVTINNAELDTSVPSAFSTDAGGISVKAGVIFLSRATLESTNFGSGIAGDIIISASDRLEVDSSEIASKSDNERSDFSSIQIAAIQGSVLLNSSTLSTTNSGTGYGGDISISARDQVSIQNGSSIFSRGDRGQIFIGESNRYASLSPQIITLNNATLNTNAVGSGIAGNIIISASDWVEVVNGSKITSQSENNRFDDFGFIQLAAPQGSVLLNNSILSTTNFSTGYAGDISISARDQVVVNQSSIFSRGDRGNIFIGESEDYASFSPQLVTLNNAILNTNATGLLIPGNIIINAQDLIGVINKSEITSKSENNSSDFSVIQLTAPQGSVLLNNSTVSTTNFGSGYAGDISISARNQVSIQNRSSIFSRGNLGFIYIGESEDYSSFSPQIVTIDNSTLNTNNSSFAGAETIEAGGISIQANDVVALTNGSAVTSSTFRRGDAGAVFVGTNGGFVFLDDTNIFSTVEPGGVGDGGNITIETGSLYLRNGSQLQTLVRGPLNDGTSPGLGNAGKVTVIADDTVTVSGRDDKGFRSAIFSTIEPGTLGSGGEIEITARSLYVQNGGFVTVNNRGSGIAGDITISVREDIRLENGGRLTATTRSGDGGNIDLTVGDFLILTRDSQISTEAGTAQAGGNGGNISINADKLRARAILAAPSNDNNIQANAFLGDGGNIRVNVGHLYDIDRRLLDPRTNDINASSTYGRQGQVNINELEIDPYAGLNNLPVETVDSSKLIAQNCPARGRGSAQEENKFIVTGRGGLPPSPNDTLQAESVVTNWVTVDPQVENDARNTTSTNPDRDTSNQTSMTTIPALVEAQGWIIGKKGEIILTAQAPTVIPHNPLLIPATPCNGF